jgi:hypothetical protein
MDTTLKWKISHDYKIKIKCRRHHKNKSEIRLIRQGTAEAVPWLRWLVAGPFTAEALFRTQVSPCGIYGGQSAAGTDFSQSSSVFPCQYHSTMAPYA